MNLLNAALASRPTANALVDKLERIINGQGQRLALAYVQEPVSIEEVSITKQPALSRIGDRKTGFLQLSREQLTYGLSDAEKEALAGLDVGIVYVMSIAYETNNVWRGYIIGELHTE